MKLTKSQAKALGLIAAEGQRVKLPPLDGSSPLILARLRAWCDDRGVPLPEREYRFDPVRKWAFDFAWPTRFVAIELEGGTRVKGGGRHNRAKGYEADCEKYNAAALAGWVVLRYTTSRMESGAWMDDLERVLTAEQHKGTG